MIQCAAIVIDNECPCQEVHCQYRSIIGWYQFIKANICMLNSAPSFHYPACPNSCEVDSILHEDMEAHKATGSLEEMKCPNHCGKLGFTETVHG